MRFSHIMIFASAIVLALSCGNASATAINTGHDFDVGVTLDVHDVGIHVVDDAAPVVRYSMNVIVEHASSVNFDVIAIAPTCADAREKWRHGTDEPIFVTLNETPDGRACTPDRLLYEEDDCVFRESLPDTADTLVSRRARDGLSC